MVNVEWCHDCDRPECRKATVDCEYHKDYRPKKPRASKRAASEVTEEPSQGDKT